jgi:hypothetical protein
LSNGMTTGPDVSGSLILGTRSEHPSGFPKQYGTLKAL